MKFTWWPTFGEMCPWIQFKTHDMVGLDRQSILLETNLK